MNKPSVAIVDNDLLLELFNRIEKMSTRIEEISLELKDSRKLYISSLELMEFTGFSSKWVIDNKEKIGFTTIGNQLRFKRKDVEEFMEQNYFKAKNKRK